MLKFSTLYFLLITGTLFAQEAPIVPEYGKLLLIEDRPFRPHFEAGVEGGVALDNTAEDVYSLALMGNYVLTPLFSLGLELTYNKTQKKDYLANVEKLGNVKISSYTPDWFTQVALRINAIKGHLNLFNKWNSPFELALIAGAGIGYNDEHQKSSSLLSWGGELQIPFKETYKFVLGVRHYRSYAFKDDELSFTSFLTGFRKTF